MTPPATQPDAEKLLTVAASVLVAACTLVWSAGQVAARLWQGTWLPTPLFDSPIVLWQLIVDPTDPANAWPAPARSLLPGPLAYYTTLTVITLALLAVATFGYRWHQRQTEAESGSARWAKPRDLKPLLIRKPQPGRLTLGTVHRRLIATEAQHSVAVIGPAGTGKTTGFAIPALLEWDGPVIATSVKGDLLEHTIDHRRTIGDTYVFDPVASTGEPTAGWSPLHTCTDWQGALRMAAWLASTARAGERGGLQDSDFWYAVAQKLLAPLLYAAATSGATMADVLRWVDLQDEQEPIKALHKARSVDAVQAFAATINREDRSRSSAYTTAETVLAAFADPGVLATTNRQPAIDPDRLLDGGNHTLYICGPLHEQARLRPLFTALIEQTIARIYDRANRTTDRLQKPLLLAIDEAANIAPLPDLAQIASTARGVGIQLVTIWQDFAQIQARYGTFAQTVINNHRAKVVLAGISDTPTLDYISRLIGDEQVTEESRSRSPDGKTSTTESTRHRPLAPTADLRRADTGTGVLVYGNLHPARIDLRVPSHQRAWFGGLQARLSGGSGFQ
ncbi:MAG: type IV secretory system conjugative DNA transfer family protein [Acidimicrobiia bacterium]|nr:type IV secretory system conjugative DNA transfer family protein [Acidimicrobiia bacterium]